MWPFSRRQENRVEPIPVHRDEETLALQIEMADARISHQETVDRIRRDMSGHRSLVDETLAAFERGRHVGR